MAHYDIFRDQLAIRFPGYGHALWEPSPGDLYDVASVGDVGYISQGRFNRLFNILLPADDPSHENFGVPEYHEQFQPKVPRHLISGTLFPDNFCSVGVTMLSDGLGHMATRPLDPGEVVFSCTENPGAVLSLPIEAKQENTVVREDFGKWMIKHIDQWFAWTQGLGLEINKMEDIVLLTGTDRTKSWANVAFLGGQADARVSFGVEATHTETHTKINWQFSPERKTGATVWHRGPSGENLPEDQCIFIRGFRVRKRMIWWHKLRAAAGPNPDPKDDDSEPEATLISIPTVPKYRDPLHVMLEYIAEERPNCDMAIVHDDDLALLDVLGDGSSLEALQTEVVLSCLRSSSLSIHEVELSPDLLSVNNSANADTECADIKVVAVASFSTTFEGSRNSYSECGRMITTRALQSPLLTSERPAAETTSCTPGLSTRTRPQVPSTTTSSIKLENIFIAALKVYEKQTKCDISSHPLAAQLQYCDSPDAIITVLRTQVHQSGDEKWTTWTTWLVPTVHVLSAFSATLSEGVGPVFSPLIAICAGIGVLLQAIANDHNGQDAVVDLFGRIEHFFQRLVGVRPTAAMKDSITSIMVEVLFILGIVTNEIEQGRMSKFFKKLLGKKNVEESLQRLDKLTQEVTQIAEKEVRTIARRNDDEKKEVDDIDDSVAEKEVQTIARRNDDEMKEVDDKSDIKKEHESLGLLISAATPRPLPALTSTVRQVLPKDFKFRILVVGKSGSGKSSLISSVFKVDVTAAPERALGKNDINFEYCPEDNRYLIVHECSGLESRAGDSQNFLDIWNFILDRTDLGRSASERLHAVWICVPASDAINGNLGEEVEEILGMRTVPVILAFTKFDVVVSKVPFDIERGDARQHEHARARAREMYEDSCHRLFQKDPRDVPAVIVSDKPRYAELVENLVAMTDRFILGSDGPTTGSGVYEEIPRVSAVPLAWSAAIRVSHNIVFQASIDVGRSRYWHRLQSNVEFTDQKLKSCVTVIHEDLVEIWNLNDRDKDKYLSSYEFKAKMSHVVKDLVGPASSLSMTSDPYPSGAAVDFAIWVHGVYKGSQANVRCIMGYIVDLVVILDGIFNTTCDGSLENVQLAIDSHVSSGNKDKIHRDIREFVTGNFEWGFYLQHTDLILEKIIDLIQHYVSTPTGNTSSMP